MGNDIINRINQPLYRLLENGLASSLRRLVLPSICDNKLLKLLGQHAKVLRHLDVMYSWHVDDDGLKVRKIFIFFKIIFIFSKTFLIRHCVFGTLHF